MIRTCLPDGGGVNYDGWEKAVSDDCVALGTMFREDVGRVGERKPSLLA